jgi:predicted ribosomally synthesized peptide with SipW-like signal peptide
MRKKILFSFLAIAVSAAIVIGGTTAFFSDTEVSTGNVFTAGSIDLKVDHKSVTYNGKNCEENCVEDTSTNLILNGSFEVPEVTDPAKWEIFPDGSTGLEWTVEWVGNQTTFNNQTRPAPALVEYHEGVLGNAQDGDQYTELDSDWFGPNNSLNGEPALVKIHQDIFTTPGQKYKLHYYFSPRPNTGSTENTMYVNIDDVLVTTHGPVAGGGSIVWAESTYEFTASNATTKIEFIGGGTDNSLGIFLDDVSVHPINCTYQLNGNVCELWTETDLTDQQFFQFQDVKPGDMGKHVISMHVFNNDAYACMYTDNNQDDDNGLTEPEQYEALDTTGGPLQGELSKYLDVFAWRDLNGDGIYQPTGETPLVGPDTYENLFINGNGIAYADSSTGGNVLAATTTAYIGFTWCAGDLSVDTSGNFTCDPTGMGNITQTDSLKSDVIFRAEQVRNNGSFTCNGLFDNDR